MNPFVPLLLSLVVPTLLSAHTTEMLGGRLGARPDGVVELRLEVSAERLPVFVYALPGSFVTWGDLRARAGALSDCFQRSLVVFAGGREVAPGGVVVSGLATATDETPLPEFVTLLVEWKGLPFVPSAVIPRFDLSEAFVMLVLDENLGGAPAANVPVVDSENPLPTAAVPAVSWWRMIGHALIVGYEHIVPHGLDHILFVLGLFFAARRVRDLVGQVTMFTVAHSITLGLAMAGVVVLSAAWARAVEIGIAVSIVVVAVENCLVRHHPGWRRLVIVGSFGLIHGLGFAGALSAVKWPANQFLPALVAANLGIELGQLTVVGGAALLTAWAWRREWYRGRIIVPASVVIGLCGLYWAIQRSAGAIGG